MNFETSRSFVNDGIDGRRGEGGESFLHFINRLYTEGGGRPFNEISSRIVSLRMSLPPTLTRFDPRGAVVPR